MENQQQDQQQPQEREQQQTKLVLNQQLPNIPNNQLSGSEDSDSSSSSGDEGRKKPRASRRKNTEKSENEIVNQEKKARLPSAEEIYNRIKWDCSLVEDIDNFKIGYEDRFDGIKFVIFSEFEIGIIPLHRVKQFKHNDKLIWDRSTRLIDFPDFQPQQQEQQQQQQQQQVTV